MTNFHYFQQLQVILMLVAQGGGKIISPTFRVKSLTLTLSAGYNQILDKPTHVIINSVSCINLTFCTNQSAISNHGIDVSIFDVITKLFMVKLTYIYFSLQFMSERPGIIKKQILKILRKQYLTLIGIKLFKIFL